MAELTISRSTAAKIRAKHGIDEGEVRDAIVCVPGLTGSWNTDPQRGRRLILEHTLSGGRALIVLYPKWHPMGDSWNLGSVYYTDL